jgi:nicotinamidase-related amidase
MRAAVLVIDMVRDTFREERPYPITPLAKAIVPAVNRVTAWAREKSYPVVFACDSFLEDDFIFKGKMKPHSLRGTSGSKVTELLDFEAGDVYLAKRRFSAFYKTDLDQTLRGWKVDTVILCGIATHFCVLATVLDALSLDFSAVLVEDATASFSAEAHKNTLDLYRKSPLHPLLRVMSVKQVLGLSG